jgi:hypothetical protein
MDDPYAARPWRALAPAVPAGPEAATILDGFVPDGRELIL